MSTSKHLRDILLTTVPRRAEKHTVVIGGKSVTLELRVLTVAERDESLRAIEGAKIKNAGLHMLVAMAHDPESGERLFGPEHIETLAQVGSGDWVDTLGQRCIAMLNGAAAVGKGSAGTNPA